MANETTAPKTVKVSYVVSGWVRGEISKHRKLTAAVKSKLHDSRQCGKGGGYSDCNVYVTVDGRSFTVPVFISYDNTFMIGSWDDTVPEHIKKAVESEL